MGKYLKCKIKCKKKKAAYISVNREKKGISLNRKPWEKCLSLQGAPSQVAEPKEQQVGDRSDLILAGCLSSSLSPPISDVYQVRGVVTFIYTMIPTIFALPAESRIENRPGSVDWGP